MSVLYFGVVAPAYKTVFHWNIAKAISEMFFPLCLWFYFAKSVLLSFLQKLKFFLYNIKIWLTLADSLRLQIKTQSGGPASVIQLVIQEILQHLLLWLVLIISFAHSSGSSISLTPSLSPSRTHSSVSLCCILGIPESWFSSRCFSSWQKHWTDERQKKQNGHKMETKNTLQKCRRKGSTLETTFMKCFCAVWFYIPAETDE